MEQVALRLTNTADWTLLGGNAEAKKPIELVVRSFDAPVHVATGSTNRAPDTEPIVVPAGEGRRLTGRWFFARPAGGGASRISIRGDV